MLCIHSGTSKPKSWLFALVSGYLGMHVKKPFNIKMLINSISLAAGQLRYFADAFSSSLVCLYKVCKAVQAPSVSRVLGYSPNLHEKSIPIAFTRQELLFTEASMTLSSTFLPCMPFLCLGYKCKDKFPVAQLAKDQTELHCCSLVQDADQLILIHLLRCHTFADEVFLKFNISP